MTTDHLYGIINSPSVDKIYTSFKEKMEHAEQMRKMEEQLRQIERLKEQLSPSDRTLSSEAMFEGTHSFRLMQNILTTMQQDSAKEGNHYLVKQRGMIDDGFNQHGEKVLRLKYAISINMIDVYESTAQVNMSMKGIPSGKDLIKESVQQLMEKVLMHMIRAGIVTMCAPSTNITPESEL